MKILIAGGSGSLGRALAADLSGRGHEVVVLTRSPGRVGYGSAVVRELRWDGRTVGPWAAELRTTADGGVAVVNLAGKLVDCRPTRANIAALRDSRVRATRALVQASRGLDEPVARWVQASTTAIYSDAGDQPLTESSPVPADGLPQMTGVAQPWEEAASGANTDHLVLLRTSVVLDAHTPALDRLMLLVRLGVGGTVGHGRQWFSWIHVADWLRIVRAALGLEPGVDLPPGPVIAASDRPVRNSEMMAGLRRAAGRSVGIPTPAPLVHLGSVLLRTDPLLALTGRHTTSEVLAERAWEFRYPTFGAALAEVTSR
ncbi:TIGR01777 family oxidoreductase [Georgenia halophila]|uniref:TIGR01777 family oxidoreductase n=1 Tax=Georgenia halophila TaxID=620889 RepID=A0ABP8KTP6_9MICO